MLKYLDFIKQIFSLPELRFSLFAQTTLIYSMILINQEFRQKLYEMLLQANLFHPINILDLIYLFYFNYSRHLRRFHSLLIIYKLGYHASQLLSPFWNIQNFLNEVLSQHQLVAQQSIVILKQQQKKELNHLLINRKLIIFLKPSFYQFELHHQYLSQQFRLSYLNNEIQINNLKSIINKLLITKYMRSLLLDDLYELRSNVKKQMVHRQNLLMNPNPYKTLAVQQNYKSRKEVAIKKQQSQKKNLNSNNNQRFIPKVSQIIDWKKVQFNKSQSSFQSQQSHTQSYISKVGKNFLQSNIGPLTLRLIKKQQPYYPHFLQQKDHKINKLTGNRSWNPQAYTNEIFIPKYRPAK